MSLIYHVNIKIQFVHLLYERNVLVYECNVLIFERNGFIYERNVLLN